MRFTEELRDGVATTWDAVVRHPFTDALADGTLDPAKLGRYLVQDYRFIDRFVVLLAAAIAQAPTLADRIPGCQFLAVLTGAENTYFERSFAALGITADERQSIPDADVTIAFKTLMQETARSGSYARMLAVLTVAEWSYLSWADRVKHRRPLDFRHREWIDLHTGSCFEGVVGWLRSQLDAVGPTLPAAAQAEVRTDFRRTIELEKAFFDHAFASA